MAQMRGIDKKSYYTKVTKTAYSQSASSKSDSEIM